MKSNDEEKEEIEMKKYVSVKLDEKGNIVGVLFEGKSKNCDSLVGEVVEQTRDDPSSEAILLMLVHIGNGPPVVCHLFQVQRLRKIYYVEYIFLKATAPSKPPLNTK